MCARKIPLDYRRHLEMQVSDCVVNCIFPSTSTLLNPMRPSSQNLVRKVLLGNNPINLHFRVCFVPNSIKCRTFFAHFVSISVLFVSVIRWHARAFHGRGRTFFRHISRPFSRPFFEKTQNRRHTHKQTQTHGGPTKSLNVEVKDSSWRSPRSSST